MFKKKAKSNKTFRRKDSEEPFTVEEVSDSKDVEVLSLCSVPVNESTEKYSSESEQQKLQILNTGKSNKSSSELKRIGPISYETEEEKEDFLFKVKKSNASKKLSKGQKVRVVSFENQDDQESVTAYGRGLMGEYTQEKLNELKGKCTRVLLREAQETLENKNSEDSSCTLDELHSKELKESSFLLNTNYTIIPDANQIHFARKKRERARQAAEFISLSNDEEKPEILELENMGQDQILPFGDCTAVEKEKKLKEIESAYFDSNSGDTQLHLAQDEADTQFSSEDEMVKWEREQIRKGGAFKAVKLNLQDDIKGKSMSNVLSTIIPKLPEKPLTSVADFISRLDINIHKISSSFNENDQHSCELQQNIAAIESRLEKFTKEKEKNEKLFEFFQRIWSEIHTIIDCLDEKASIISELEARYHVEVKNAFHKTFDQQKRFHYDDLLNLNDLCFQQEIIDMIPPVEDVTDSFGRKKNDNDKLRRKERENLRRATPMGLSADKEEKEEDHLFTYCSAGLPASIIEKYQDYKSRVFVDADPKYGTLEGVLEIFRSWRETDPNSYKDAFASLCIPKIILPFVHLEVLLWTPLELNSTPLESMNWFELLLKYGDPINGPNELDLRLIPPVFERVIIPKLTGLITHSWNVAAYFQTIRLKRFILHVSTTYAFLLENQAMKVLSSAILEKLKKYVEHFVYFPKVEFASAVSLTLITRSLKILKNCLEWSGILPIFALQDVVMDSIINPRVLPSLKLCPPALAVYHVQQIISVLPAEWITDICCSPLLYFVRVLARKCIRLHLKNEVQICIELLKVFKDEKEIEKLNLL